MLAGVLARFPELDGASFVAARQENLETIHQHNVLAERHGLLSELRTEIGSGSLSGHQTTLDEWLLDGAPITDAGTSQPAGGGVLPPSQPLA
jgi:GTP cyclohydrolase I/GTP cyclohydrolase-4